MRGEPLRKKFTGQLKAEFVFGDIRTNVEAQRAAGGQTEKDNIFCII